MRNSDMKLNKHHVIPSSRNGGAGDNIIIIKQGLHRKYHDLFENKTPYEILAYLQEYFWGGNDSFIKDFVRMRQSKHAEEFNKLFRSKNEKGKTKQIKHSL